MPPTPRLGRAPLRRSVMLAVRQIIPLIEAEIAKREDQRADYAGRDLDDKPHWRVREHGIASSFVDTGVVFRAAAPTRALRKPRSRCRMMGRLSPCRSPYAPWPAPRSRNSCDTGGCNTASTCTRLLTALTAIRRLSRDKVGRIARPTLEN